jgi:hypothetical protein
MKTKIAIAVGALMLAASPAALAVGKPEGTPSHGNGHAQSQGAAHSHGGGKEKAPGQVCKGESRKHEKGEKGTAFSRCVHEVVAQRRKEHREEREARQRERKEEQEARKREREEAREGEGA